MSVPAPDGSVLARVVQTRRGPVAEWGSEPRTWTSGIGKHRVSGPVHAGAEGLTGDEQADRRNHGGPEKALFCYPVEHYPRWRTELALPGIGPGAFGENLALSGCDEHGICVGDIVRVGSVEAQVSQPRRPCWKPARRWDVPDLAVRTETTGRTGWYLRVLAPGTLEAGDPVELLARPRPAWTVARAGAVMRDRRRLPDGIGELAELPELAEGWRRNLRKALDPASGPPRPDAEDARRLGDRAGT